MTDVLNAIIYGLTAGSTLALIGLGLVLIYRATDTFNFAHGQFMAVPALLVGYWQAHAGPPFWVAAVLSILISGTLGALFYRFVLGRTVGMPVFMAVIVTLGLGAILDAVLALWFGSNQYTITIPGMPAGVLHFAGVNIRSSTVVLAAFSLLLAAVVAVFIRYTPAGARIRAAGQDALLASQVGINVNRTYLGSWFLATALAGLAGVVYGSTNIAGGGITAVALLAFPAIMLGGLDSVPGAVLGGLIVGLVQGFASTYLGGEVVNVVTYGLLLVVLMIRPHGLLGTKTVSRL